MSTGTSEGSNDGCGCATNSAEILQHAQAVCTRHPFQSKWLTVHGGIIGTAANCENDLGETHVRYKGVVHSNYGRKAIEGTRVQSYSECSDVLLRKRA